MAEQSLVDLGAAMAALRVAAEGADYRLLVEGEEVLVHSQVLAARCYRLPQVPLLPHRHQLPHRGRRQGDDDRGTVRRRR